MRCRIILLSCLVVLEAGSVSVAAIRPSFFLDEVAWRATDVVVATEGDAIDGRLVVLEVWKGRLSAGDALTVTDLKAFASAASRTVKQWGQAQREGQRPIVVSGQRMILFLCRGTPPAGTEPSRAQPEPWQPAARFGGMKVSIVWVEADMTYAFMQLINPGPSLLVRYERNEKQIKQRTGEIAQIQRALARIAEIPALAERAAQAAAYATNDLYDARQEAFRILTTCQTAALPHLREMLADATSARQYATVLDTMVSAGGATLGPEFTEMLEAELEFWKSAAPALEPGWWNGKGLDRDQVGKLQNRYGKTLHVLYGLHQMEFEGARQTVQALRDYWRSLPQLKLGNDQMGRACDAVLQDLDDAKRPKKVQGG